MARDGELTPWGDRILKLLDGRPQANLAKEAGLDPRTLGDIIRRTTPSADKALRIARALGTTVEWLMEGDPPPAEEPELREPSAAAYQALGDRLREAHLLLEEATQAVGVIPDEALRQVLLTLIFRHRVPVEEVALILAAKARPTGREP